MRKLLVVPGYCDSAGGMVISVSMLIKGFERCNASKQLRFLVRSGSFMEQYLQQAGQGSYLQSIQAKDQPQFVRRAIRWVSEQPRDWPLLLENCVNRNLLSSIVLAAPALRLSGRPVYHLFRDLASSYHPLGGLARRIAFACLSPGTICNSHFTAKHIDTLVPNVWDILYPAVDTERFNDYPSAAPPPENLQPIIRSGARVMLTPTRISEPGQVNDKNLRALIPVLAELKAAGHNYHGVIIGEDRSPGQERTRTLLEQAKAFGVADYFTVLPPTFAIEDYYKHAHVVVSLAPREPFGRTVIEAIACGVPVVGSQSGGINETLQNFASEWTVDPNNPAAVAQAIVRTSSDPNTPMILAQGKRWVEANCSPVGYARRLAEIAGLDLANQPRTLTGQFLGEL